MMYNKLRKTKFEKTLYANDRKSTMLNISRPMFVKEIIQKRKFLLRFDSETF
jgi:hypothetical protein